MKRFRVEMLEGAYAGLQFDVMALDWPKNEDSEPGDLVWHREGSVCTGFDTVRGNVAAVRVHELEQVRPLEYAGPWAEAGE